jgi:hypothetical protein
VALAKQGANEALWQVGGGRAMRCGERPSSMPKIPIPCSPRTSNACICSSVTASPTWDTILSPGSIPTTLNPAGTWNMSSIPMARSALTMYRRSPDETTAHGTPRARSSDTMRCAPPVAWRLPASMCSSNRDVLEGHVQGGESEGQGRREGRYAWSYFGFGAGQAWLSPLSGDSCIIRAGQ